MTEREACLRGETGDADPEQLAFEYRAIVTPGYFTGDTDSMEKAPGEFTDRAMRYHKVPRFTAEEVSLIRGRITYLAGNDDPFQKIGGREALIRNGMNAVFYDGAGHGLNHELSDEINRKIVGVFLDAQGGREWSICSPNART